MAKSTITPAAKLDLFTRSLQWRIQENGDLLAAFAERIKKDPSATLSWAGDYFRYAAEFQVAKEIQAAIEKKDSIEAILQVATERAMRAARYPARSTSPCSNLMDSEVGAAWADMAEKIGSIVNF